MQASIYCFDGIIAVAHNPDARIFSFFAYFLFIYLNIYLIRFGLAMPTDPTEKM